MLITITPITISENYNLMASMMEQLQASEQSMHNKSAPWAEIKTGYMNHLISMQQEQNGTCLLARANGEAAGFMVAYTDEEDESRIETDAGEMLYISDGFVYPAFRRLGIYKELNTAMEQLYLAKGIRRILRYTLFINHRMQHFLQQQGYQPVRVLYEKWLTPDGIGADPVVLTAPDDK